MGHLTLKDDGQKPLKHGGGKSLVHGGGKALQHGDLLTALILNSSGNYTDPK